MNQQRLKELEMINACRQDTRDTQVYESSLSKQISNSNDAELESIVREIIEFSY